jgi:hypothetical protein
MKDDNFVHLCQPDDCKSCGACCGLYNYADSTKGALLERLKTRTERFRRIVRGPETLAEFSALTKTAEDQTKRYEVIYCCEYLGFLTEEQNKVGCLLHPLQNGGNDLRGVSFYGRELCDGHFCPSYHYISREEKLSLVNIIDDWYLYGLCVTDIDLVKEWFRFVSERIYETPAPERFEKGALREVARDFFSLKINWPYRSQATNRLGKYYFDGSQYMINHIDYETFDCERSRFDKIFLSLCSEFHNRSQIEAAEAIIQENIDEFVRIY